MLIAPLTLFANPARPGIKATYLSAGGEVHTPISVRCSNDSTYTVTDSGLRIDTLVYPVYADDYNGYALVLPEAIIIDDKDGYTFAYYNFTTRHTTALRQKLSDTAYAPKSVVMEAPLTIIGKLLPGR